MIQRLRVDNFGCLVNFELRLERMQLLLGPNGSGTSTVFEILRRLQRLLGDLQALIISHHPLMVDREAAACGLWLDRLSNGPTRLSGLSDASGSPMPLSLLVERGWILGS